MIQTEAYFSDIQETLLGEIKAAKRSIYVAVAWFTDTVLFDALVRQLEQGVSVAVVIVKDEINENCRNDYDRLKRHGGEFFAIEGNLMHNKFCIIDERIVITGSYNWTYNAASKNHENIIITYDDSKLSLKFIQQFRNIIGQQNKEQQRIDNNRIIKRLNVIKYILSLEDDESIASQIVLLKSEGENPVIPKVETAIKSRHFSDAISLIDTFITESSRVTIYEDPMIAALLLEVKDLEYRLLAIDNTLAEKEKTLRDYTLQFNAILGELIEKIYYLKKEYMSLNRQESQYSESEYQQAKAEYEEYSEQRATLDEEEIHELTEAEQKELTQLYKKAVVFCHTDIVVATVADKAAEVFKALKNAYQSQDLVVVKQVLATVEKGIFTNKNSTDPTLEQLQQKVTTLRQKLHLKEIQLDNFEQNESYQTVITIGDWTTYFGNLKIRLVGEKKIWESKQSLKPELPKVTYEELPKVTYEELPKVTYEELPKVTYEELTTIISNNSDIHFLTINNYKGQNLPKEIKQLTNLVFLNLSQNELTILPKEIGQLSNLIELNLRSNNLTILPKEIRQLSNLTKLYLDNNQLISLPKKIKELINLTDLDLGSNQLIRLPKEIGQLTNLTKLDLINNELTTLPEEIGQLINLTELGLINNNLRSLPKEIGQLTNLTKLDLINNELTTLPEEIGQLINLTELCLINNNLRSLPKEIGQLTNLTRLLLGLNNFSEFEKKRIRDLLPKCYIIF
jgi:Leucine-rich repeat (LRR) protein